MVVFRTSSVTLTSILLVLHTVALLMPSSLYINLAEGFIHHVPLKVTDMRPHTQHELILSCQNELLRISNACLFTAG